MLLKPIKKNHQFIVSKNVTLTPKGLKGIKSRITIRLKERNTKTLTYTKTEAGKCPLIVNNLGSDLDLKYDLSRSTSCNDQRKVFTQRKQQEKGKVQVKEAWPKSVSCTQSADQQSPNQSDPMKLVVNWSSWLKSNQSGYATRNDGLKTELLALPKKRKDARRSLSMLELTEHAQLIRSRIKMKSKNSSCF